MQATHALRSPREIREQIEHLAEAAQSLLDESKKQNRIFNRAESARFDEITETLVPALKTELAAAIRSEMATLGRAGLNGGDVTDSIYPQFANQHTSIRNRGDRQMNFYNQGNQGGSNRPQLQELEDLLAGRNPGDRRPQAMYRVGRLRCFRDPRDAFDAGMWFRAVLSRVEDREDKPALEHCNQIGWELTNAASESSGAGGGYLVPAPLANTIIDVREAVGVARRIMRTTPMTSDTLTIPKRKGGLTVYYPGEMGAITPSTKDWKAVALIAKKRAVANQISQELVDDAILNIVDNAVEEMAYALADQEDNEVINGTGASTFGGVVGLLSQLGTAGISQAAAGHDTWPELDLADITAAMGLLPDRFHARMPVWLCSSAFYFNVMLRINAQAGGNTIVSLQGGDNGAKQFLGYPVYLTQYMPKTTAAATVAALFGAFDAGCILGERIGIRVARSDDYAFLNDLTTLKATTRTDFNVHDPGDATNPGAYIGLKTAA